MHYNAIKTHSILIREVGVVGTAKSNIAESYFNTKHKETKKSLVAGTSWNQEVPNASKLYVRSISEYNQLITHDATLIHLIFYKRHEAEYVFCRALRVSCAC